MSLQLIKIAKDKRVESVRVDLSSLTCVAIINNTSARWARCTEHTHPTYTLNTHTPHTELSVGCTEHPFGPRLDINIM